MPQLNCSYKAGNETEFAVKVLQQPFNKVMKIKQVPTTTILQLLYRKKMIDFIALQF